MLERIILLCYNFITITKGFGGNVIEKLQYQQKLWYEKRSRKILRDLSKKKKRKNSHGVKENYKNKFNIGTGQLRDDESCVAPAVFSIEKNPEGTIEYFNSLLEKREINNPTEFVIDLSPVITFGIGAIMFLLAIIEDTHRKYLFRHNFRGNYPNEPSARRAFLNSGFLRYVKPINEDISSVKPKNIEIINGFQADPASAKKVCLYVHENCGLSRIDTIPLYNMLIELMGNTRQHAYINGRKRVGGAGRWYLYAGEKPNSDYIEFVFLDTGLGIPTTVSKKIKERFSFKDSDFIKSALNGDFRTKTKKKNRGKGLPQISECLRSGLFSSVLAYSGKGCCELSKEQNNYVTKDYKNKIFGTLFCWQIKKSKGSSI